MISSIETPIPSLRGISRIVTAHKQREGGGFVVRRPVGGPQANYVDPFLMLDHFGPVKYGPGEAIGAPSHPHRGFETVTYMLKGSWEHKDSHGNTGTLSDGWVQWMTAGSGVVHSEMPSEELQRDGGENEGFQLWVNLPESQKMVNPKYQDTPAEDLSVLESQDGKVFIKVIAGSETLEGNTATSPIETRFPIAYLDERFQAGGASHKVELPPSFEGFVYCYRGAGTVNGNELHEGQAAILDKANTPSSDEEIESVNESEALHLMSAADVEFRVLVICGKPLHERVSRYGPFVMTTKEQIIEALLDYERGNFGSIDGGDDEMKRTREARAAQQKSGRWASDTKDM